MGGSAGVTIALAFAVALLPFGLWTWWMVNAERALRVAPPSDASYARVHPLPVTEPMAPALSVRAGSFCRVPGSIGFAASGAALVCTASERRARPRWRRLQAAA